MKLGLMVGYSGAKVAIDIATIREAERLGYDSAWTAEAWGSDAVSPLAWIAAQTTTIRLGTAIMQLPGRSPANTAMTAMTLDALSNERFILGLGTSGPQVVEGWHGVAWHKPLTWLREYLTIVKTILAREAPLTFKGERYRIPYDGPDSAGLGKPLKSMVHGRRDIPIFSGAMAPLGQELCGELCDGVLLTCMNPEQPDVIYDRLRAGRAKVGKTLDGFEIAPTVAVAVGDDVDALRRPFKEQLALYIGGMGAKEKNFYREYLSRVGFEADCARILELFMSGQRKEAVAAVPDKMVDVLYLIGPKERIRDRLAAWKESGVTTLIVGAQQVEAIRVMAELAL
ncbi:MAG TPA: LLM class F420-dependent oxidoreductase [Kofleriaceae bacterium]|nr:LLM class F420-dependent oxidoreductase [Kofleriaceae bacterium]